MDYVWIYVFIDWATWLWWNAAALYHVKLEKLLYTYLQEKADARFILQRELLLPRLATCKKNWKATPIICVHFWLRLFVSLADQYLKDPHWYRPVQVLARDSVGKFCKGSWSMSNDLLEQSAMSENADHLTLTFCILGGFCFSVDNWSVWLCCNASLKHVHGSVIGFW